MTARSEHKQDVLWGKSFLRRYLVVPARGTNKAWNPSVETLCNWKVNARKKPPLGKLVTVAELTSCGGALALSLGWVVSSQTSCHTFHGYSHIQLKELGLLSGPEVLPWLSLVELWLS